jgi:hypothetical protein
MVEGWAGSRGILSCSNLMTGGVRSNALHGVAVEEHNTMQPASVSVRFKAV